MKKYRGIYYPLLISTSAVVVIVALIFSIIFHRVTLEKNEGIYSLELQNALERTNETMQNSLLLLHQIAYDSNACQMMSFEKLSVTDYMRSLTQLRRYLNINSSLESIYLYNAGTQSVFVCGNMFRQAEYTLSTLPDSGFAQCLTRNQLDAGLMPVARTLVPDNPQRGREPVNVFTFLYTLSPSNGTYQEHDTVAAQFNADALVSLPASQAMGSIMIYATPQGEMQYASCDSELGRRFATVVAENRQPENAAWMCRQTVMGREYYCFSRYSAQLGWMALLAVPYETIGNESAQVVRTSLLICAGLVLLAWLLSLLTSRRIYLRTGLEKMRDIAEQNLQQQTTLRRQLVSTLVQGRQHYEPDELEALLLARGSSLEARKPAYAVALRLDRWNDFLAGHGKAGEEQAYQSALECFQQLPGYWEGAILPKGELFFLYQTSSERQSSSIAERLLALGRELQKRLQVSMDASLSLMTGNEAHPLCEWSRRAPTLREALYIYRLYHGYGVSTNQTVLNNGERVYPKQEERSLLNGLKMGDFVQARISYDQFVTAVAHEELHYMHLSMVHLVLVLDETIAEIVKNNSLAAEPHDFDIYLRFEDVELIEEINAKFYQVFDRLEAALLNRRSNRQQELAERMADYIQTHYGEVELSRQQVSDALHISYAAAGGAFKTVFSSGISAYIIEVRLKNACTLLKNTPDTIDAIAAQCGFSSIGYFHKIFKREFGVTPGEYRRNYLQSEEAYGEK